MLLTEMNYYDDNKKLDDPLEAMKAYNILKNQGTLRFDKLHMDIKTKWKARSKYEELIT